MGQRALSRIGFLLSVSAQACSADFEADEDVTGEALGSTEQELGCAPPPEPPPVCGGIAGLPCPGQGTCVDDPSDECDPKAGGADCIGIPRTLSTCLAGIRGGHVACSVCKELMVRKNFGGSSGIVVDVCGQHGVWFDPGELAQVLAFCASGGVDRAEAEAAWRSQAYR